MIKSSYITLAPAERSALLALYARVPANNFKRSDIYNLCSADSFQALIDKGLIQPERNGRWRFSARGVSLAKLIASERRPYERAYYLTAYNL
jgi:hypothetical protein